MGFAIEEMLLSHYDQAVDLWNNSEGVRLESIDSRKTIGRFLERNPGLSYVAMDEDQVVGAVLCSHDERIGYLTHLAVAPEYRLQGIGRSLASRCLYALMKVGIRQFTLMVLEENQSAIDFVRKIAVGDRMDVLIMKKL